MVLKGACEDVVGAPPEAEEGAEEEGCAEAVVDAPDTMTAELRSIRKSMMGGNGGGLRSSSDSQWARYRVFWTCLPDIAPANAPLCVPQGPR